VRDESFEEQKEAASMAKYHPETGAVERAQFPESLDPPGDEAVKAWELVDPEVGRYMPRRIRGSFRGRALG
jgi:hypothetical protein